MEQTGVDRHLIGKPDMGLEMAENGRNQVSLVSRLRSGDRDAAEELVDRYYGRIYVYFRELGHGRQTSEDLTQETFLQVWLHIGQLKDGNALNAWIFRIATNVSGQYWRRNRRCKPMDVEQLILVEPAGGSPAPDRVGLSEEIRQVRAAIQVLPIKLREAVVLHYLQGFSIVDSADMAGVRQGTFKSRLSRALDKLRSRMD